jgi:hypothetical protein
MLVDPRFTDVHPRHAAACPKDKVNLHSVLLVARDAGLETGVEQQPNGQ